MSLSAKGVARRVEEAKEAMEPTTTPRHLAPAVGPVYLVLLWPQDREWQGRIKDVRSGAEHPFASLSELWQWLQSQPPCQEVS